MEIWEDQENYSRFRAIQPRYSRDSGRAATVPQMTHTPQQDCYFSHPTSLSCSRPLSATGRGPRGRSVFRRRCPSSGRRTLAPELQGGRRPSATSSASESTPFFKDGCHGIRQTLEGSFSAVSKPNFASKYAFESSCRDLHNTLFCTSLKSLLFSKMLLEFCQQKCEEKKKNCYFFTFFRNFARCIC